VLLLLFLILEELLSASDVLFSFLALLPVFHFERVGKHLAMGLRHHQFDLFSPVLFGQFYQEMPENAAMLHLSFLVFFK
jgi:hypothetical protein